MANTTVSVSFANGFVGDYSKNNESSNAVYLTSLGWSQFQFVQSSDNGQFGGTQGNDLAGTILITDAAGVQHAIAGAINWRAPSGAVSTVVFFATGGANHTLATTNGTYVIDPFTLQNGDPHSFIGLTFNGQNLVIAGDNTVSGNAATAGLLTILNNYLAAQPQLSIGNVTVDEAAGIATLTVLLSKVSADTVTVGYGSADGSGTAGSDYTAKTGTLTFAPGELSKTIQVSITDDALTEGSENFNVVLSNSTFAAITGNTGVVTITDNDSAPVQSVSAVLAEDAANSGANPTDSSVVEGAGLLYTVTLSAASPSATEHTLAIGGSATAADYGAFSFSNGVAWKNGSAASGIVVVPANVGGFSITVPSVDDSLIENPETLVLTVGGVAATGTITDNDIQSVSTVLAEDAAHSGANPIDSSVVEGASLLYTVLLSGANPNPSEHTLAIGGTAAGADYGGFVFSAGVAWKNADPASGILVVPANVGSFTITVASVDDALIESAESLVLTVGGVSATGTITDNDAQSVSGVSAEDAAHTGADPVDGSVVEGAALRYTVILNAPAPGPTEHTLTIGGTASGADYGGLVFSDGVAWKNADPASGILVVPANVGSFTITVPTSDDALIESAESLVLTVGGVSATGTITDNDAQSVSGVISEDAAHTGANPVDSSVVEGAALRYTVILNAPSPGPTEHTLGVGGTASGADYGSFVFSDGVAWKNADPASAILVVPANVGSFTITVPTSDDALIESAESLVLTVGGVAATGTITDNDNRSVSAVIAEDAAHAGADPLDSSVVEGVALRYSVSMNATSPAATEHLLALGGSAAPADYGSFVFSDGVAWKNGDPASGIVLVPGNLTSFTVTVPTVDDTLIENTESLVLSVGGVSASGTITDNDSQSVSRIVAEDAAHTGESPLDSSVVEGNALRYTVVFNAPSPIATEHTFGIGGSASAGDYGAMVFSDGVAWKNADPGSGILLVPANVGSFTISVATVDDTLIENAESLALTVGGVSASATISDNDAQSVSAVIAEDGANRAANPLDSSVVEGASLVYTVALTGPSPVATEHTLSLGGSAAPGDYASLAFSNGVAWKNADPASGIVLVPASLGGFTVTVATIDDSLIESAESLVLTVGGVSASGTITDNDSQSVVRVVAEDAARRDENPVDASVVEGAGLLYTVSLNGPSPNPTEFTLGLGGTASAGDYGSFAFSDGVAWKNADPAGGVLVVPANVSSFTIGVPTLDDALVENTESLVLTVGGVAATGTITDNDVAPPTAPPPLGVDLNPASDDGNSNSDRVTGVITPEFNIKSAQYLSSGGSVRLLDPAGHVVGLNPVSAADVAAGLASVKISQPLDDGVYTFMTQILDANGKVLAQSPVNVTIVTDIDGIQPSVELAAHNGDYNKDGIPDWQQHAVAQFPLATLADFTAGKNAPQSSFGAILAGAPDPTQPGGAVLLTPGAQLLNLSVSDLPAALPANLLASTPAFNFSITSESSASLLPDIDGARDGRQTRVVIDLAEGGVVANDFLKWDKTTQTWFSFLDDQRLATLDDGATLLDLNGDGRIDRIVLTLTDGGRGDEDGIANGTIVDPGVLVFGPKVAPPPAPPPPPPPPPAATPVFSVLLAGGDRYYSSDAADAAKAAAGAGARFEGARFDSADAAAGGQHLTANYQPFTADWYYGVDAQAMPYACFAPVAGAAGFSAWAVGSGNAQEIHLYQNTLGLTQLLSQADAQALALAGQGYADQGAKFNAGVQSAFAFDAEGFLVANKDNAAVRALVQTLAGKFGASSNEGFIDAVEQSYLSLVQLVGIAHGGSAGATDVNAAFDTHFS